MVESKDMPATSHQFHVASSCMTVLGSFFMKIGAWSQRVLQWPFDAWELSIKLGSQLGFPGPGSGLISDINDYQCMPSHWMKMRVVIAAWQVCRCTQKKQNGEPSWPLSGPPPCPAHQPRPGAQQGRWPMWPPHTNQFGASSDMFGMVKKWKKYAATIAPNWSLHLQSVFIQSEIQRT